MSTLLLAILLACGTVAPLQDATVAPPEPPSRDPGAPALKPIPPLPDGIYLQMFSRSQGKTWRIAEDGTYLVRDPDGPERVERPISRLESGGATLSVGAMERLRQAVTQVGFYDLPAQVETGLPVDWPTLQLTGGWGKVIPQTLAFSVRDGDHTHTVEILAEPRVPNSLGRLTPLFLCLDHEAMGGWMME